VSGKWWRRIPLILVVALPVLVTVAWWQALGVSRDAIELELPSPVWRWGDPGRGDLVALNDIPYSPATVVGLPGDRLAAEPPEFTSETRLTVESNAGTLSLALYNPRGISSFPPEVPRGSLLVFGEYWGDPTRGCTSCLLRVATLVRPSQVRGTVLDDWRKGAVYAVGTTLGLTWMAAFAFVIGRLTFRR
jgi:hypothetical protein